MGFFYDAFVHSLPDAPVPLNRDVYTNTAVLAPLLEAGGTECFLLEKRSKAIRQGGEICFPGGMVEKKDGTARDAALRETVEELGIAESKIEIGRHFGCLVAGMGAVIDVFIGRINASGLSDFSINNDEVESLHFVPVSFFLETKPQEYSLETIVRSTCNNETGERVALFPAKELGIPEKYHDSWPVRKTRVYVYKYQNLVIWGLTAEILRALSKAFAQGVSVRLL